MPLKILLKVFWSVLLAGLQTFEGSDLVKVTFC